MNKNILITGSSGFLGEELVNYFSKNNKIFALDKEKPIIFDGNISNINNFVSDIRDKVKLEKIFKNNKIDIIIHCAAEILDEKDPNEVWKTNYNGTKNLLDFA
jgi:nucleoside-diphosphate-sugar epimerase